MRACICIRSTRPGQTYLDGALPMLRGPPVTVGLVSEGPGPVVSPHLPRPSRPPVYACAHPMSVPAFPFPAHDRITASAYLVSTESSSFLKLENMVVRARPPAPHPAVDTLRNESAERRVDGHTHTHKTLLRVPAGGTRKKDPERSRQCSSPRLPVHRTTSTSRPPKPRGRRTRESRFVFARVAC